MNMTHYPPYTDRLPWYGGDLQTLRNFFIDDTQDLAGQTTKLHFPTSDGTGDILTGTLHLPHTRTDEPTVFLIHGLTGCEDSTYVRASTKFHLSKGRAVIRVNLRGAGPSRQSASGYYFAGCVDDIQDMFNALPDSLLQNGLFAVGYSLGGNILLNYLGTVGSAHPLIGAATISAPIHPSDACARLMNTRNKLYHSFLLQRMKNECLSPHAKLSSTERSAIKSARTLYDFDDFFTAPRNGYHSAADYYEKTAGMHFAPHLKTPTLLIHAQNDPWIPAAPYRELQQTTLNAAQVVITPGGGHVGFHDKAGATPWHDRSVDLFIRQEVMARPVHPAGSFRNNERAKPNI